MLHNLKDIEDFAIHATDGNIGKIKEFYFDDQQWVVRYLVVETGSWMSSQKVLLSPISIKHIDWKARELGVDVTKAQVEESPSIDTHKPVSKQNEMEYLGYYGYALYWGNTGLWGGYPSPYMMAPGYKFSPESTIVADASVPYVAPNNSELKNDHHLRSNTEVTDYHIETSDGELGHLQGMLVDPDTWAIRYLIVNTSNWWVGHLVLVAPQWIKKVTWIDQKVHVALTQEQIKSAPPYDASTALDRASEEALHVHYGHQGYWKNS